ncbi:MAG TPA: GNAT family protein [Kineosporiaceae bacterium]|nr:GNAT family protein [Kineosporiaceae bacterium]
MPISVDLTQLPTLTTEHLRLVPLGPEHFEGTWAMLQEPEGMRLTGTHATFSPDAVRGGLQSLALNPDRADWAITLAETGDHLGEVVLNQLDQDNASMNFRIVLRHPTVFGRGYGTEATRAVVDHGLDGFGLHRIQLEVFSFNPRARRVYEKSGFVAEGSRRDALHWDGQWVDAVTMAILSTDPRPWRA